MLNARGAGSQGSLHDRNLTGRLHLQRCLCALFKSSLTNRTLKRSIYFLWIVREMAAEKTAGQDLALLYPSILLCSPAPPPLSLAGYKNRNNNENLKKKKNKKREGSVAQANCRSQLWSVEAHAAAEGRFYISKYLPPGGLSTHPILQMICAAL